MAPAPAEPKAADLPVAESSWALASTAVFAAAAAEEEAASGLMDQGPSGIVLESAMAVAGFVALASGRETQTQIKQISADKRVTGRPTLRESA
jgi:hypothetical protein